MTHARALRRSMSPAAVVAAVAAALMVAGCSSGGSGGGVADQGSVSLKKNCGNASCAGTRNDAKFDVKLPSKTWNGTLVIWSHGYRNAVEIPANPLKPGAGQSSVDTGADAAPSDAVAADLTAQGYALAGSAFKTNGWDVQDGVAADEDLYSYFSATFGKPNRVYIWGASLGGLITETLAEKHHDWVSGVAPLCGVLGGTNLNLDLALDVAYMVKTLVYPELKLTGYASAQEAVAAWTAASQAVFAQASSATPAAIAALLTIAAISGAPDKTATYDGSTPTSVASAYVEGIITALGYGTWGRYDLEQRAGGNPSTNADTDYSTRVSDSAKATINAVAPGQLDAILAKLAAGPRVTADAAARAKADSFGDPTGAITVPTITMHTVDDPLVLVQNETVFQQRVLKKSGQAGDLIQLFTSPPTKYTNAPYGAGHCNFTKQEAEGVITLLDNWVRGGIVAGPGAVATVFDLATTNTPATQADGTATNGITVLEIPPPWPAKIS